MEAIDHIWTGFAGGAEDGEEPQGGGAGIVGGVGQAGGDVGQFADFDDAVFFTDVLGHFAFEHVEDFLVDWVEVVIMRFAWGKSGADEEQVFSFDHASFDEPFDVAPFEVDVFGIGGGDITIHEESENGGWWELGEGWFRTD